MTINCWPTLPQPHIYKKKSGTDEKSKNLQDYIKVNMVNVWQVSLCKGILKTFFIPPCKI